MSRAADRHLHKMDMDEDDDIYVPEEPIVNDDKNQPTVTKTDNMDEGDEDEGAAMDEDNDSDDDSVCSPVYTVQLAILTLRAGH